MKNKLIVALDVDSFSKAKKLVDKLSPYVKIFKVGSELFTCTGPSIIKYIKRKRCNVFLDLKFYDIPNTVRRAVTQAAKHGVAMLTLHVEGGLGMMKEAKKALKGIKRKPLLLGVTVLTSKADRDAKREVKKRANLAKKAGFDGIVSSPMETKGVKKMFGNKFIVVNPGVRPAWIPKNDQKRVTTPEEAVKNGANFIVVGRPIIEAEDPVLAAERILKEIAI